MLPQDFTAFVSYRLKCGSLVLKISEESFMLLPCPAPDAPALACLPDGVQVRVLRVDEEEWNQDDVTNEPLG